MRRRAAIAILLVLPLFAVAGNYYRELLALPRQQAAAVGAVATNDFTIRFLTGTFPTQIVLSALWDGPANASAAQYDPGNGNWVTYTSRTILLSPSSGYISFRGSWTNASGTYKRLFYDAFSSGTYTCQGEGAFSNTPAATEAYRDMFYNCVNLKTFVTNPVPNLTTFANLAYFQFAAYCSGLTNLPANWLNTSGASGAPEASYAAYAMLNCSGLTSLPANCFNTTGMIGNAAAYMFYETLRGCSGLTTLPANCLNLSGLTGNAADYMCQSTLQLCTGLTSVPANTLNTGNMTGNVANSMFWGTFQSCTGLKVVPSNTCSMANMKGTPTGSGIRQIFYSCTGLTNDYVLQISSNVAYTAANVAGEMLISFYDCPNWKGDVKWGTNSIYLAIPSPDSDGQTFYNCTSMPNWASITNANWK